MARLATMLTTLLSVSVAVTACTEDEPEVLTCEQWWARTSPTTEVLECGLIGYGYALPGVSYYDEELDVTWAQRVLIYEGELGVVGRRDVWTAGCEWFPCDYTR